MVKFVAIGKKGPIAGFCLSEGNIKKLREGMPIYIDGKEMGFNHDVVIMYGKTESDIEEMVKPLIGKNTEIRGHYDG